MLTPVFNNYPLPLTTLPRWVRWDGDRVLYLRLVYATATDSFVALLVDWRTYG